MDTSSTPLKVTEVALRDAHQSLLATRMRTEDMLPIGEKLDQVGFFSLEMWGGATFDSCLRFLNEDPWERVLKLKKVIPNTPFQMLLRGQNCVGYRHYADDVVERFVKKSCDVGINIFRVFDALNDLRNIETAVKTVKKCGETVEGCISYTVSPVHNLDLYVKMARDLVDMGSDIICIKDMAGLLTPHTTKTLISGIKKEIDLPIHLHTHATTGLVGMNLQSAIDAGVDMVDTAISSLSMGTSHYATECIVAAQKGLPRDTGLDLGLLEEISIYFRDVRKNYAAFESDFKGVDINILKSQIPGGMISNMENQLKEQNALDKLGDVLLEVPRVRKDMGYPPLVTPTSQIVGSQATLNVLTGERYKLITKETRECVLGKYGKLPATLDPHLLAKVVEKGEVIDCRPADLLEPEWEQVVKECEGKCTSEEDMLSYALFPKVALQFFDNRAKGIVPADPAAPAAQPTAPAAQAAAPATGGSATYTINVNGQAFSVQVSVGGAPQQAVAAPATSAAPAPAPAAPAPAGGGTTVTSPLPGSVFSLKVAVGDQVSEGDVVIIMESMKMETEIHATANGSISSIQVQEGQNVKTDDPLLVIG
ncbi:MAG TPA: sodium-extruding oxaloacetate decarboxylase subunit alpha [Nitrospinaceae bacterium]|jgi:oxaloacetate decarboxylase alpha subunit|nr:oxaloacetate decarboxylase subunit alpha [Nitrospinota bacterium]MDP6336315.1 sodium-extruding oxaloacetate decarboxylase subunit alpha [Nitrospinaceae bacterium]HAX45300.1 oxaloacetate decarboxylase subunit alpha [Nitrospina sp.]MBV52282.1 oxaloacetate decarboxylase subunit alpha [Nitrospinota bacterium]MDP7148123.1 sodium-extruding oxaloacetate decarboxylase subunit alpha [Nitrospinaceae bacterium]|tara:strand:- start:4603 stop:6384 length:1782 start_codon:yes stop_codon:yes gene_type:complete